MNNTHFVRDDYRAFTDYRSSCQTLSMIQDQNNITNNYDLKELLQNKAEHLLQMNTDFYKKKVFNGKTPKFYIPDPNGNTKKFEEYKKNLQKTYNSL